MKKGLFFLTVMVAMVCFTSLSQAEYLKFQISNQDDCFDNYDPIINEAGQVVWTGRDMCDPQKHTEIFFL